MDVFETSARILSLALGGSSLASVMAIHQQLRQDEVRWLLKMFVDRNLLKIDSAAVYWTTLNGVQFLEIQFHMELILWAQKTLN